jgi:hypothetical protein
MENPAESKLGVVIGNFADEGERIMAWADECDQLSLSKAITEESLASALVIAQVSTTTSSDTLDSCE